MEDAVALIEAREQHEAAQIYNMVRTHWSLDLHTPHAVFHRAA